MKSTIHLILIFVFTATYVAFAQQTKYVKAESENLRAEPNGKKIGVLLQKTPVEVIKESGKWSKVRIEAWIYTPSLTSDLSEIKAPSPQDLSSAGSGFYYKNVSFNEGFMGVSIVGEILNKSGKPYQVALFKLSAYDNSGKLLENADIAIMSFSSGSTKSFDSNLMNTNVNRINNFKIQFVTGY